MTRVLILGGTGMLGHKLWQVFRKRFDTYITMRTGYRQYAHLGLYEPGRTLTGVDAFNMDSVTQAIARVQPDFIVNCIGIVKQREEARDPLIALTINSLFPHRLAAVCHAAGTKLIHISTDCVFSGGRGMYRESDVSDADDLYGRTKYLGEVHTEWCLTLRTSIIGRQIRSTTGLVEWFLSQSAGSIRGYRQAIFGGFTTLTLADILGGVIQDYANLSGLYHVSSTPIKKYDLLKLVRDAYGLATTIQPDDTIVIDRSLDSSRFWSQSDFEPPPWPQMIQEMADDPTPYDRWREL